MPERFQIFNFLIFNEGFSCICYSQIKFLLSLRHKVFFPRTANKSLVKEIFYAFTFIQPYAIMFPSIITNSINSEKFPLEYF